jgi:small subunit ribosomal protein S16
MVKIRLRRTGGKKKPTYRVVVTDSRAPRDGRFIEIVGHYNPRAEPATVKIHEDRVLHWLSVGAQPTDSVKKLLENLGTLDRFARLKEGADLEELLAEAAASPDKNSTEIQVHAEEIQADSEEAEVDAESSEVAADSQETPSEDAED